MLQPDIKHRGVPATPKQYQSNTAGRKKITNIDA
jgi:hypothetical protein